MSDHDPYQLLVTIVSQGHASHIVEAARAAGARGGTILRGRGSGIHETSRFFGVPIEPEKEIVLILVPRSQAVTILDAVVDAGELRTPGKGIAFVLDVPHIAGIAHPESMH